MKAQSRAKGVTISYISTAVRTLSKLFLTPVYLNVLGLADFGFYQYIFSIASYVTILDFGITSVINTFSIRYKEEGNQKGVENVMFYTLVFTLISSLIIIVFGLIIIGEAPLVFGSKIIGKESLTRNLLVLMITELIMLLFQHYFEGVILASEKYVTLRGVDLVQILLRCAITLLLLFSSFGLYAIALGDFIGVGLCLLFEIIYCFKFLGLRIKHHYKDGELIRGIATLSLALCLQSLISFLNSSIDKYILGRYINTIVVSVYTIALTFSMFFDEIATAIQRLYLPQVVKRVALGASGEELTDMVIKPGRYQLVLCGGVLGAFILFGRHFIELWTGKETLDAWAIGLMLMIPSLFPLIQNVCLSILTAMNKRMFRSYVLGGMTLANLVLTLVLVPKIGLMGAPIGTMISLILGNNIAMNIYYRKVIGINVFRLFKGVLKGIFPCFLISTIICSPLVNAGSIGVGWFLLQCLAFSIVYFSLLWLFGFNKTEKERIINSIPGRMQKG